MRRAFGSIVLVIATVASIATSRAFPTVLETAPLPETTLVAEPVTYQIEARYTRNRHENAPTGFVRVALELRGSGTMPSNITSILSRDGDSDLRTTSVTPDGQTATFEHFLAAWQSCPAEGDCVEQYTLTLERLDSATTQVEITGLVEVEIDYFDEDRKPALEIIVTELAR